MQSKIALAGNPNSGKTTLFNALTGSRQFVGNWPGVTVEKKEGRLKGHSDVVVTDLPGIYSLSPYTPEEEVAREYLTGGRPDAVLNIVDGTNLERNLYLTTQLMELGLPVVVAVNRMDVVQKNGDTIHTGALARALGCPVVEISALKGDGVAQAAEAAVRAAREGRAAPPPRFSARVEQALARIQEAALSGVPAERRRWYAVKLFERDEKVRGWSAPGKEALARIEKEIEAVETGMDDDAESIMTNERYACVAALLKGCCRKKNAGGLSVSDKIDRVVTNRFLALPIFAVVMFVVYFVSVSTVGAWATDWTNDSLFGGGWHLFGIGSAAYEEAQQAYALPGAVVEAFEAAAGKAGLDPEKAVALVATAALYDENGNREAEFPVTHAEYRKAAAVPVPEPGGYGVWVPGLPVLAERALSALGTAGWLQALVIDGILAGVGAVLGFVPQMLVLFLFLAFLESCGYMARVAFVMDRIFRKFGLSGKSFIPLLIGTGCGVPGIMASRTIENENDRRMTIITTTFIPCGAKLPVIALIAGALFGGAWWVAPSAYFMGMASILLSGVLLKKTRRFAGGPAPFVMELPAYHLPAAGNLLRSMWERGWSFIKKAGGIILLASILVWFTSGFGWRDGRFGMVPMDNSLLAAAGRAVAWVFAPLGWGNWQGAVATLTGLIAKENVVGTFGVLFGGFEEVAENGWQVWANMRTVFTPLAAYSFLVFNLLCAPCFAAVGAIRREMNSAGWTWFAVAYQCGFAYAVSLMIYQFGMLFAGQGSPAGSAAAFAVAAALLFLLVRPGKKSNALQTKAGNPV